MDAHRYRVGQLVRFVRTTSGRMIGGTPSGDFRVVRLLPASQGTHQYRVESTGDHQNRVALESEIAACGAAEDGRSSLWQ